MNINVDLFAKYVTINIFEYQKELLRDIIASSDGALITYADAVGQLIHEHNERLEKSDV